MPPDACARSAKVTRLPCLWLLVGWDFAVQLEPQFLPIGPVERDALSMISQRHRAVATTIVREMSGHSTSAHLNAAARSADQLRGLRGFEVPSWADLAAGVRPIPTNIEEVEPGWFCTGWQHEAASRLEWQHRERHLMPVLADSERALLRAQSGPAAGMSLSAVPSSPQTRIESQLFRVLLLRRLRLPLPPASRLCRCGRLLYNFGHHRASCAQAGVLGRRGFAVESAAARICREARGRVATNVLVRDLDIPVPVNDGRRLEVVVDGLPLFGGAQLAVDTTLVSSLHCDGSPHRGAADVDGAVLVAARRRKERTYPELVRPGRRARLVVLAGDVAGRWSEEAVSFIRHLAKARARSEPTILRKRAEQAWRMRWCCLLACAAARAFAASLLERRAAGGADGETPTVHHVVNDWRFASLDLAA